MADVDDLRERAEAAEARVAEIEGLLQAAADTIRVLGAELAKAEDALKGKDANEH